VGLEILDDETLLWADTDDEKLLAAFDALTDPQAAFL